MKFISLLYLALPALSLAQTSTPAPEPDLSVCEEEAGGYARYCARCEPKCAAYREKESYAQCLYSVFTSVNYNDSQCWQHGGNDCANKAVDIVCGTS
ncbi:hypothetical protein FALBO_10472 [Fusarium albosuccineum]|uniref:Uncharacterized protein n=2 Tax=Fusarium decemcellulare species complex TaxID=1329916 RepID=A0A8H4L4C3_9HYPO|nr:hypothetical protein FALBO_10472 [Fusarium albosuccineum]KAF5009853.1 hypothetical protein FDECE_3948 [Fusarium decemcellulare]KAJ3531347.1 hypothetical protein NM208_g8914 [Fusarium decemcellulare]